MTASRFALAAALSLLPLPALAHPHIFAEARLEIVSDDSATVTELRNVWRFDDLFSASVLLDFDKNSNGTLDPDELAEVGQTVLDSLAEYNYYTTISDNGKQVKVAKPSEITADFKDNQLLLIFAPKRQSRCRSRAGSPSASMTPRSTRDRFPNRW